MLFWDPNGLWPGLKEAKAWLKEKKDTFTTAIKVMEIASRFITPDERMRNEAALYGMAKGALSVAEDTVSVINTGVNVSAVGLALVGGNDEDVVKVFDMVGDELNETADNVALSVTGGLAIVNNVIQDPLGTVSTINAQALQFQSDLEAGDLGAIAKASEVTTSLALDAAMGAVGELASGARAADTAYELSRVVRRSTPRSNGFSLSRFLNTEISVQWHRGGVIADTMGNQRRVFPGLSFSLGGNGGYKMPNRRHFFRKIIQGKAKPHSDINTVIDETVDVAADVAAINAGEAERVGNTFIVNGRVYGFHADNMTLFPVSGVGFTQMTRGGYNALGTFNKFGKSELAFKILEKMHNVTASDIELALNIWKRNQ